MKVKIEKVSVYRTSDGKEFEIIQEAELYARKTEFKTDLVELVEADHINQFTLGSTRPATTNHHKAIVSFIIKNRGFKAGSFQSPPVQQE